MKYLAILRDSLRETIDGKVFLVMLILSLLAMLLTASMSFTPEPPDKALLSMTKAFDRFVAISFDPEAMVDYRVENVVPVNQTPKPWDGEYRFEVVAIDGAKMPLKALVMVLGTSGHTRRRVGSTAEPELEGAQQARREELQKILEEAANKPPDQQRIFVEKRLAEMVAKVKPEELEEFIKNQLATRGNLEVTSVRMMRDSKTFGATRFQVEAKGKSNTFNLWPHSLGLFFGALDTGFELPIGPLVLLVENYAVGSFGAAIFLLISSIMTSFFIPNMLRKGTVDLVISKPIHRWVLLLYKYIGGLLFMLINTIVLVGGFWLVMGLRTGLWGPSFLLMIPILTFQFAIYYAVSALAAVLSRNTIVAIMATCIAWATLFVVGQAYAWSQPQRGKDASSFHTGAKIVYKALPRIRDLDKLSQYVVAIDLLQPDSNQRKESAENVGNTSWTESITVSMIFVSVILGLACWRFSTRDY
jgi:ABC-type transport system involved in multi-copper enzyme maturation permease subunit